MAMTEEETRAKIRQLMATGVLPNGSGGEPPLHIQTSSVSTPADRKSDGHNRGIDSGACVEG
jgi:hypothetical protein